MSYTDTIMKITDTESIVIRAEPDYVTIFVNDGENDQYATVVLTKEQLKDLIRNLNTLL